MENFIFEDLLDPDVLYLAQESLPDILLAVFGIVGVSVALSMFLFFTFWGTVQIVRFVRSIIKA